MRSQIDQTTFPNIDVDTKKTFSMQTEPQVFTKVKCYFCPPIFKDLLFRKQHFENGNFQLQQEKEPEDHWERNDILTSLCTIKYVTRQMAKTTAADIK